MYLFIHIEAFVLLITILIEFRVSVATLFLRDFQLLLLLVLR